MRLLRAAWVIARRDYAATVLSRAFLLFLLGPLLPLVIGGLFGAIATGGDAGPGVRPIGVAGPPGDVAAIRTARTRIAARLGDGWMPPLGDDRVSGHPERVMLLGGLAHPLLTGPRGEVARLQGPVRMLLEEAHRPAAAAVRLETKVIDAPIGPDRDAVRDLARGAQAVMFVLTMILAGMLVSNLVEEKSSKVIEVLAAAVPVDAIFAGKLLGMLGVSLTGIAAWGTMAGAAAALFLPPAALPVPAVGWPLFALLGLVYFASVFLLLGALYLGVGAQAGSVREVQTISLPLTMLQLLFFALASTVVTKHGSPLALAASIVPWSSPFAMLARAGLSPALWPHPLALAWQGLCLVAIVAVAARLFRRNVLRSGGRRRL